MSERVKDLDSELMLRALELGAGGDPTPNPHVGALIADADGKIVAEGFHEAAGLDHAEVVALKKAGAARAATSCTSRSSPATTWGARRRASTRSWPRASRGW